MARRRRRRRRFHFLPSAVIATAVFLGAWWLYQRIRVVPVAPESVAAVSAPALTTNRPELVAVATPPTDVPEKGTSLAARPGSTDRGQRHEPRAQDLLEAGRTALEASDLLAARTYFNDALRLQTLEPQRTTLRAELTRLGHETIFSGRLIENDPFVLRYVIQPKDTLGKIAKANKISVDLLAEVNGIVDANRIRAGQSIKIIQGPFHAVIDTESYTMGVYLENTFVKQFRVGLGADQSTPRGQWRVGTKLKNPTYYPPRGGPIIAADDPNNPLGERWIGLSGVSGEAAGQLRYGIHGTNDPDSIGKSVSLGCIRMYNEDVEALFTYLIEKHSTVTVK